jgi:hypothetical protein
MIFNDRKKAVGVILSGLEGKKEKGSAGESKQNPKDSEMPPEYSGKHAHAEDMIAAMHNKDPHGLVSAMNNFLNEHEEHEEEPQEEESDYSPGK